MRTEGGGDGYTGFEIVPTRSRRRPIGAIPVLFYELNDRYFQNKLEGTLFLRLDLFREHL